jgi:small subunit ribosomal protein S3Ae
MAVGKNKRLSKKKTGKKKAQDPFLKKDWYDVRAPSMFEIRTLGKTPISRTQGTKIASEEMKGRVFSVNLGDLVKPTTDGDAAKENEGYRKIRLICEEVQGKNVLTQFHGMDLTRDKTASLMKKWQTLVEAFVDIKTADGYTLRIFAMGFTKRAQDQVAKASYATSAQVRAIRAKMVDVINAEVGKVELKDLVRKFLAEAIEKEIESAVRTIYPLRDVFVRKVKVLKAPKFDLARLREVHGEGKGREEGAKVARVEEGAVEAAVGSGGRY